MIERDYVTRFNTLFAADYTFNTKGSAINERYIKRLYLVSLVNKLLQKCDTDKKLLLVI